MKPTHFEAIKVSQNIEKNYITFLVHPDDTDNLEAFYNERVGATYMVAVVPIGDNSRPQPLQEATDGVRAYKSFSTLCRNERFQKWLYESGISLAMGEENASVGLKAYVGVGSRSEIVDNSEARQRFINLRNLFTEYCRKGR